MRPFLLVSCLLRGVCGPGTRAGGLVAAGPARVGPSALVTASAPVAGELPLRVEFDLVARHLAHRVRPQGEFEALHLERPPVPGLLEGGRRLRCETGEFGELGPRLT